MMLSAGRFLHVVVAHTIHVMNLKDLCTNRSAVAVSVVVVVQAMILVERETQVPIILGRGAAAMKKLGSASRQQIEEFLGRPVYLELGVQVRGACSVTWRDRLCDLSG